MTNDIEVVVDQTNVEVTTQTTNVDVTSPTAPVGLEVIQASPNIIEVTSASSPILLEVVHDQSPTVEVVHSTQPLNVEIATPGTQGVPGPPNQLTIGTVEVSDDFASADISGSFPNQQLNLVLMRGPQGSTGPEGPANVLTMGTVTTGAAGSSASASISGSSPAQSLSLVIPRGDTGATGPPPNLSIGTVTTVATGGSATATITGSSPNYSINLGIPTGATGPAGPANTLSVGTVTTGAEGSNATVTISGTSPNQSLSFSIPRGNTGPANTLSIGTVTTGAAGSAASASITGSAPNQTLSLTIPRGNTGVAGPANVLSVGTVTSLPAGSTPTVTITGTSPTQTINFGLVKGDKGDQGIQGPQGPPGTGTVESVNGDSGPDVVITYESLGQIPNSVLPPLAISDTFPVASQAEMLALTAQRGDVAVRSDTGQTFILRAEPASTLGNWTELSTPATVSSVNGYVGAVVLTKSDVGLGNVLNVAQEPAIAAGTTTQYYRGDKTWQTLNVAAVAGAAPLASPTFTGTVSGITKAMVGLGNVDNTSDVNKPVSTAQQTALNAKENTITAGTTTQYWRGDKTWQTLDKSTVGLGNVANTAQVDLTNAQTIAGIKTFTSSPVVPDSSFTIAKTTGLQSALDAKEGTIAAGTTSQYYRGDKTWQTLNPAAVGAAAAVHTHTKSQITDFSHTHLWADITDKPTTFTPSAHTHIIGDVTGLQTALDAKAPLDSPQLTTPTITASAATGGLSRITFANPGVGGTQEFIFTRSTDSAGMRVTEPFGDQIHYEFYMSDNPDGLSDRFKWVITDWQGNGGYWEPLMLSGIDTYFIGKRHDFKGTIVQARAPFYSSNSGTGTVYKNGTGTVNMTPNVTGYTNSNGSQVYWIRILADTTTFEWGTGNVGANIVGTGIALSTSPVALNNGITVTFSATTGAVAGDYFQFRVYSGGVADLGAVYDNGNRVYSAGNKPTPATLGAEPTITAGTTGQYYRGDKTWQTLNSAAVGLGNVANVDTTNATNISSGTLADARLSTNVATLSGTQTFSGSKTFSSEIIGPATGNVLRVGDDARLVDVNIQHVMGIVSQTDAANQGGILFGTTAGNFRLSGNGAAGTATGSLNVTGALTQGGTAVVLTNDARLSDARTPIAHTHDAESGLTGTLSYSSGKLPYPIRMGRKDTAFNLNTAAETTNNGFWCAAPGSQNTPEGAGNSVQWFIGWTIVHDPSQTNLWVTQFAQRMTGPASNVATELYMRRCVGNTWGAWTQIAYSQAELDLRYLNASNLNAGTVPQERLTQNVVRVVYTTTVPARPANATYVEWVGNVDPGANALAGDTWVPTA